MEKSSQPGSGPVLREEVRSEEEVKCPPPQPAYDSEDEEL